MSARSEKEDARLDRIMIHAYEDVPATTQAEAEALRDDNRQLPATVEVTTRGNQQRDLIEYDEDWQPRTDDTQPPAPVGTPWEVTTIDDSSLNNGIRKVGYGSLIATTHDYVENDYSHEAEANAQLIVQAVNSYTTNQQRIRELERILTVIVKMVEDEDITTVELDEARAVLNRGGER